MQQIKFKQSTSTDVVKNRVRLHAANTAPDKATPYDEVAKPTPAADGYSYIDITDANLPKFAGKEGRFDIAITAVDAVGNESPFLDIDNALIDLGPPVAPTDGSVV